MWEHYLAQDSSQTLLHRWKPPSSSHEGASVAMPILSYRQNERASSSRRAPPGHRVAGPHLGAAWLAMGAREAEAPRAWARQRCALTSSLRPSFVGGSKITFYHLMKTTTVSPENPHTHQMFTLF